MKQRLQVYYDSAEDPKVHELIQTFENKGKGQRGYTSTKIKECLKVYQILAERCGTYEPMDLLLHYIEGNPGIQREDSRIIHTSQQQAIEYQKVSDEVDKSIADLIGDGDFTFED
jgi:hypothetical protein